MTWVLLVALALSPLIGAYLADANLVGRWPFTKLKKPPEGTRWELVTHRYFNTYGDMHLIDSDGVSVGNFIAFRNGKPTSYWRSASKQIVKDYRRSRSYEYSPELAGYRIERKP